MTNCDFGSENQPRIEQLISWFETSRYTENLPREQVAKWNLLLCVVDITITISNVYLETRADRHLHFIVFFRLQNPFCALCIRNVNEYLDNGMCVAENWRQITSQSWRSANGWELACKRPVRLIYGNSTLFSFQFSWSPRSQETKRNDIVSCLPIYSKFSLLLKQISQIFKQKPIYEKLLKAVRHFRTI